MRRNRRTLPHLLPIILCIALLIGLFPSAVWASEEAQPLDAPTYRLVLSEADGTPLNPLVAIEKFSFTVTGFPNPPGEGGYAYQSTEFEVRKDDQRFLSVNAPSWNPTVNLGDPSRYTEDSGERPIYSVYYRFHYGIQGESTEFTTGWELGQLNVNGETKGFHFIAEEQGGSLVPPKPGNLTATSGNESVTLSWDAVTDAGTVTYAVYQYQGESAPSDWGQPIATNITEAAYTVTGLTNGMMYWFAVKAVNESGSSDLSDVINAVPHSGTTPISVINDVYLNDRRVQQGTPKDALPLPETVWVMLSNNDTLEVDIAQWDDGTPAYDGNTPGTYLFTGSLGLPQGVGNPDNYTAQVKVIVISDAEPVPAEIVIQGETYITAPALGDRPVNKTYTAIVKDQFGNEMEGEEVIWQVSGESSIPGISMEAKQGILTVTSDMDEDTYTYIVAVSKTNIKVQNSKTIYLSKYAPPSYVNEVYLNGPTEIQIPNTGSVTKKYEASLYDQYDNTLIEEVEWTITSATGVSFATTSKTAGRLTVTNQALPGKITIRAAAKSDLSVYDEIEVELIGNTPAPEKVDVPIATPPGGTVQFGTLVTLSSTTAGATIYYTTDGSMPTSSSIEYTEPIEIISPITIKAIAVKPGMTDSEVMTEHYTMALIPAPTNLTATAGDRSVSLTWNAVTGIGSVTYAVYSVEGSLAPVDPTNWRLVQSNIADNTFTVTGLTNGTSYTFVAKAAKAGKTSDFSNIATATPRTTGGGGGSGGSGGGGAPALSDNADLADLQVWANEKKLILNPSFAAETTEYTIRTEADEVEIRVKTAHSAAKVMLNDKAVVDRLNVPLKEGDNKLVLTVQAENGTKKDYKLTIYREIQKPSEPAIEFTDIAGHWAERDIKRAAVKGIVNGYPDGTFKPNNPITRAEFTVMLVGALKLDGQGAALTFIDNDQIGTWAKGAVSQAVQAGIVSGYEDGSFRPNAHITRAEMAVMIARALKLQPNADASTSFADDEAIPLWAKGAVEAIRKLGIVSGRGGNKFVPNEKATRAEAVVMLLRMLDVRDQR